ncbi:MAG: type II secretion system F family protein [Betaproteobacteria bacterium]|nr:type II secretion system F family protein [Betaproteobacteria bacterium]
MNEVKKPAKEYLFDWRGIGPDGQLISGDIRAPSQALAKLQLASQGIQPRRVQRRKVERSNARIKTRDITIFTRQLATMMKAGVPLLQAFDIVARGSSNPTLALVLRNVRSDIEIGTSLSAAFRKFPEHFNALYCNLVAAGEAAGILDALLERLAVYMEKTEALKSKIKSALMYPISVILVAFAVLTIIMLFVIPSFKSVFSSFGAELPAPTLFVIALSDAFVANWYLVFGAIFGGIYVFLRLLKTDTALQIWVDKTKLRLPVFGTFIEKACVARWARTLSTMFAAGVPLVEALQSVGAASGNLVFERGTERIRQEVSIGTSLGAAMARSQLFPGMMLQMAAIGEESGALDRMLAKAADFYEAEVDDAVAGMYSLIEPFIIVFLGGMIGSIVVAMYLPIFKIGGVV